MAHSFFDQHAEDRRCEALVPYRMSGPEKEDGFASICELAAHLFSSDMAYVSLVDANKCWIKSAAGRHLTSGDRHSSLCNFSIQTSSILVILDTHQDERMRDLPPVTAAPFIRFYAGAPLITANGERIGALCIADETPRAAFSEEECANLAFMARLVIERMDYRRLQFQANIAVDFVNASDLAMVAVDKSGCIQFINAAMCNLFGYSHAEFVGQNVEMIIPKRFHEAHKDSFARTGNPDAPSLTGKSVEVTARRRNGTEVPIEITLSNWGDDAQHCIGAIIKDVSARRERDAQLLRLANHDTLTGLHNRHRFEELLHDACLTESRISLLLIELDDFSEIGDRLGQEVCDSLLQNISVRLPMVLPKNSVISRMGETLFGAFVDTPLEAAKRDALVQAVFDALDTPFQIAGHRLKLSASIGHATSDTQQDGQQLLANADFALWNARKAGGRTISSYDGQVELADQQRRVARDELLSALHEHQFVLHYQPQVLLETGEVSGIEALIRWHHPQKGLIMPGDFLPALEQSALSLDVGLWVLGEAIRQLGEWTQAGLVPVKMGINLFPSQMRGSDLAREVSDLCRLHAVDPRWLELEITETATLQDEDRSLDLINELRALGIGVAFDDFGTGYASLGSLQRYPITTLKIDRSFVRDLMTRQRDASITRALIMLSKDLGLSIIAEGIETMEQQIALRLMGCDFGQGYLFGKAMPADDIRNMLSSRKPVAGQKRTRRRST
ncbi:EAL domain-containing protein [Rhizobium sp. FY34]|uniref:putative bifunctional diguanylate cyclase/phosphodiesterase n=1 Tax=Rhizobium sp. FY34 TaxID=2562309 RepID=UPI0010BFC7F9|nr:EAL domain-containing protein [Rhizobium sp. FY34]